MPIYADTATIGNPATYNVYIDGDSVDVRTGTTINSSFSADTISLGKNSSSSVVDMCGGYGNISCSAGERWSNIISMYGTNGAALTHEADTGFSRIEAGYSSSNGKKCPDITLRTNAGTDVNDSSSYLRMVEEYFLSSDEGGYVTHGVMTLSSDTIQFLAGSLNKRDATIQGATVLYENSSGTTGTVTLSESAANFDYLEIYPMLQDGVRAPLVKVSSPDGKTADLNWAGTWSGGNVAVACARVAISGAGISFTSNYQVTMASGGTHTVSTNAANLIYITKVVGYK